MREVVISNKAGEASKKRKKLGSQEMWVKPKRNKLFQTGMWGQFRALQMSF